MRHTFVVYVEDKPGVLNRIASLFRRRAFNIESLTVGHTETAGVSRMTILVESDAAAARRLEANLYKLVNVLRVHDITAEPAVYRELAMVKVSTENTDTRSHVMQIVDVFRARIVDVAPTSRHHRNHRYRRQDRRADRGAAAVRHPRTGPDRPPSGWCAGRRA